MPVSKFDTVQVDESCNPTVGLVPSSYDPKTCQCHRRVTIAVDATGTPIKGPDGNQVVLNAEPVIAECKSCIRKVRAQTHFRNRTEHKREYFRPDGSLARTITFGKRIRFDQKSHKPIGFELFVQEDSNKAYTDAMHIAEWTTENWPGWRDVVVGTQVVQAPAGGA